jgi:glycosyltransferase involved in cell wall biosynthesis
MRRHIAFLAYLVQWRFAEALARLQDVAHPSGGWTLWTAYQLKLYQTVAAARWDGRHLQLGLAIAVSLAACGRSDEAADVVRRLLGRRGSGRHLTALAAGLAPFAPNLALEVIQNFAAPIGLHAALLLRVGNKELAAGMLRTADDSGKANKQPELHLLLGNAVAGGPLSQLARMNAFLGAFALPSLALRDTLLPPGQMNLRAAEPLTISKSVRGPLVSVLMTAYQSGQRIEFAINSLLEQTYRDIEIIVIDDASSDDTGDIVKALAARDPRVIYLRLPRNVGTYVAKSIGLRHASGEFVTCHDSDDWSHPLRIEMQVRPLLDNKRLVFTTSHWVRIQDDGVYYARPIHPLMRLNPASPLFRKAIVLAQAGGWDVVRTGADSEFIARLKLVFGRRAMRRIALPLAFGAHRPDSLMTAADTSYCAAGMSPVRLAYWEGWGHWHIDELRAGRKPFISLDLLAERRFVAPAEILVERQAIQICLGNTPPSPESFPAESDAPDGARKT